MTIYTTLNEIHEHAPCSGAWAKLLKGHDKELRLFACQCARLVLPIYEKQYPEDGRPRKAIEAAEAFALGRIGKAELEKAYANAADAARAAYAAYACAAAYADACAAAEAADAYAAYADAYADTCAAAYTDAAATYAYAYADACADACAAAKAVAAYTTYATYGATRDEIEKLFRGIQS